MSKLHENIIPRIVDILDEMFTRLEQQKKLNEKEDNDTMVIMAVARGDEIITEEQGVNNAVASNGFSSMENALAMMLSVVRTARDVVADFYAEVAKKEPELGDLLRELMHDHAVVEEVLNDEDMYKELVTRLLVSALTDSKDCGLTVERRVERTVKNDFPFEDGPVQ